jgi:hypothetical protein
MNDKLVVATPRLIVTSPTMPTHNQLRPLAAQMVTIKLNAVNFDTFTALAKSDISDPQGVSAGIGTELLATAVGIGAALICVMICNAFLAWIERLSDETKLVLLKLSK